MVAHLVALVVLLPAVQQTNFTATNATAPCALAADTAVVYSLANGVGGASKIWVQDLLWWWSRADRSLTYQSLSETEIQNCDLAASPALRLFINPGGNAYDQLTALGAAGTQHVKAFVQRGRAGGAASAYAGFCAGGYIAAQSYLWETLYEGPGYYNFAKDPPLGIFPHLVEGSLVDISDDQFGDQFGSKARLVNVSNGHQMLYYGGSSFGWNGVADLLDPASPEHDAAIEGLLYYEDFYGFRTANLPAAWSYRNVFISSIHAEADNCTVVPSDPDTSDCTPAGTIPADMILANRAWLAAQLNAVAGTNFSVPTVPRAPSFDTTPPHSGYPAARCAGSFCDSFDAVAGEVPSGLWRWERNQTYFAYPQPWNTTFIGKWGGVDYGAPHEGNGYAIVVPKATQPLAATITSRAVDTTAPAKLTFAYKGKTSTTHGGHGAFTVDATTDDGTSWKTLLSESLAGGEGWTVPRAIQLPPSKRTRVRFSCLTAQPSTTNFCAIDSVKIA
jgi:glutamine amidotransferase-like uncharacterized protein